MNNHRGIEFCTDNSAQLGKQNTLKSNPISGANALFFVVVVGYGTFQVDDGQFHDILCVQEFHAIHCESIKSLILVKVRMQHLHLTKL